MGEFAIGQSGLGPLPSLAPYKKRDGSPMYQPPRPAIAIGRAMHVGYPVAVVGASAKRFARPSAAFHRDRIK
jgi:carbon-monoxide dehydrogenase large subunit